MDAIASSIGTPVYVYSSQSIREQYRRLDAALARIPHRLHYSVKANSNLAILSLLRSLGAGLDIVSGGELYRALRAGFSGADIVFSGVGKTTTELGEALDARVLLVNVESEQELYALDSFARAKGARAPVAIRVNPEVTVDTPHPYTRTGERGTKFGVPYDQVAELARVAVELEGIDLIGLDMHIGSQIDKFDPYRAGVERLLSLKAAAEEAGAVVRYLDIGGGLAVSYDAEHPVDVEEFGRVIASMLSGQDVTLLLEPGRYIVGNAGVLLTRVLYRKRSGGKEIIVTDAGMTDLLRPSHYQAFHGIEAVVPADSSVVANVVGPVCESGDFFALDREVADVQPGALLAIRSTGAYGYVMASNYNTRPKPSEVLVDGSRFGTVTERERYEDIVRSEHVTPQWREV
jgi:diaminopimelate decarboxylase